MLFKIKRSDGKNSKYEIFDVKPAPHMSVLEALFKIQDEQDSSLSFRYSCRGAVCGSCAMLINKKQRLACRTQVSEIANENVISISPYGAIAMPDIKSGGVFLIEPLPNLPVIKDLIVDLEPFFKHYKDMQPWFDEKSISRNEMPMLQNDVKKVDKYAACILCGLCYGACPAVARNIDYPGPAALAKAWRFFADSRYRDAQDILKLVDRSIWSCNEVYRCVEVCPKKVPPTNAITGFMRKIILYKLKTIMN